MSFKVGGNCLYPTAHGSWTPAHRPRASLERWYRAPLRSWLRGAGSKGWTPPPPSSRLQAAETGTAGEKEKRALSLSLPSLSWRVSRHTPPGNAYLLPGPRNPPMIHGKRHSSPDRSAQVTKSEAGNVLQTQAGRRTRIQRHNLSNTVAPGTRAVITATAAAKGRGGSQTSASISPGQRAGYPVPPRVSFPPCLLS